MTASLPDDGFIEAFKAALTADENDEAVLGWMVEEGCGDPPRAEKGSRELTVKADISRAWKGQRQETRYTGARVSKMVCFSSPLGTPS